MLKRSTLAPLILFTFTACSSDEPGGSAPDVDVDPVEDGCPSLFAQEVLQEFEIEIDDSEWEALRDEFRNRDQNIADGVDPNPYHPIVFRHDGEVVEDAMIRLKGASSWGEALAIDGDGAKMQFVISFNEKNEDGRYRGRRKIALDMPRSDWTFLRQRLALHGLRSMGVPAQCANSAKLIVNGEYYGLYSNVERMDRELLERLFPENPDGDLWEGGRIIKTNEDEFTWDRLEAFWTLGESGTVEQLADMSDLESSVKVWAAEAVLPHGDGYYMGRANFYLYDHPDRGFVWLPNDLDSSFDFIPAEIDAIFPWCAGRFTNDREHYLLVMDDPSWRETYVAALEDVVGAYDVADMELRFEQWSAQIHEAAEEDPNKPFSFGEHQDALDTLRHYFAARATFLEDWIGCRDGGGPDDDGDGVEFCHDCDDADGDVGPHMDETCNEMDDDCDGRVDELADCSTDQ